MSYDSHMMPIIVEHNLPPTLAEPNVSPESPLNAAEEQEPEEDEVNMMYS